MSIYLASTKSISRAKGQSAVASASYRAGVVLEDNRYGKKHDYSKRDGVVSADIILPTLLEKKNISIDRSEIWNLAEKSENRKNSRVAREWLVNLPHELSELERKELAHSFAKKLADKFGVIADCAIHEPTKYEVEKRGEDPRNFHAHIMLTTRKAELDQVGKITLTDKADCELSDSDRLKKGLSKAKDEVKEIRKLWENLANQKLAEKGLDLIDSRSYEDRGLDIIPQIKVGSVATEKERNHYQRELEKRAENPSYVVNEKSVTPPGIINAMIFERNELIFKRDITNDKVIDERINRTKRSVNQATRTAKRNSTIIESAINFNQRAITSIERNKQLFDTAEQTIRTNSDYTELTIKHDERLSQTIEQDESYTQELSEYFKRTSARISENNRIARKVAERTIRSERSNDQPITAERSINNSEPYINFANRKIDEFTEQFEYELAAQNRLLAEKLSKRYIRYYAALRFTEQNRAATEEVVGELNERQKNEIFEFSEKYNLESSSINNLDKLKYAAKEFFVEHLTDVKVKAFSEILLDSTSERFEYSKSLSNEREQSLTEKTDIHTLDMSKTSQRANKELSDDYESPNPF